jgi:hypothetical protein
MKMIIAFILLFSGSSRIFSQNHSDSNFVTLITAANWMPDGKSLLLKDNLSKNFAG